MRQLSKLNRQAQYLYLFVRITPQGTVDNNLGPDRLAGPKALDPNYCRQPTLLIARPLSGSPNCAWY